MSKPSKRSPERKLQVVLSALSGEVSVAEAARRCGRADGARLEERVLDRRLCGPSGPSTPMRIPVGAEGESQLARIRRASPHV